MTFLKNYFFNCWYLACESRASAHTRRLCILIILNVYFAERNCRRNIKERNQLAVHRDNCQLV